VSKNQQVLLLVLAGLVLLFLFNGHLFITDDVESNYALTAKEMVQSGDWLSPQIYGQYWYDKPIFFYWLTALGFKLFGFTEFAARFFPALFSVFSLLLVYWFGRKLYSHQVGLISGFILATSLEFWLIGKFIITDSALFFFFNGALAFFYLAYRGTKEEKNYYYLFYLFCGLATLTKGPIGFLLPGLIITLFFLYTRNWAELKAMKIFTGAVLFLVTALPWYYLMYLKHGEQFLLMFFGVHNFLRATVSEHPRDNVIYYYLLILILGFFPWVAFLPQTLRKCIQKDGSWLKLKGDTVFLLLWFLAVFIFFQMMATKYITYTLPILFPLSVLVARFLGEKSNLSQAKLFWPMLYLFLFGLLFPIAGGLALRMVHLPLVSILPSFLMIVIGGGYCLTLAWRKNNNKLVWSLVTVILLFNIFFTQAIFIPVTHYRSAKSAALALKEHWQPGTIAGAYGEYHTSAVFYSGKKICRLEKKKDIAGMLPKPFSWTSKNVMPFMALEDIPKTKKMLVIVDEKSYPEFLEKKLAPWKVLSHQDGLYLLEKI